jgi:ERCC4-type nuclease
MLISPTEPTLIKNLGKTSSVPERYGCDVLILEGKGLTGIQRKQFPEDLMASMSDGRMSTLLGKMEPLERRLLVIEGYGRWTQDDELVAMTRLTKGQLFGIILSLAFEFGIEVLRVRDISETVTLLVELEHWCSKEKHHSLVRRPGPKTDGWGRRSDEAWGMHLLQGFPGIGPDLAARIIDHYGGVPLRWDDGIDLTDVPGIGKVRAEKMYEALSGADGD